MALSLSDRTRDMLVQSVLIVFSVLLALFLDELRNDYKQSQQRDQVVANVIAELTDNAQSLETVMGYHEDAYQDMGRHLDSLEAAGVRFNQPAIQLLPAMARGGIQEPTLQRTAWESAQVSAAYDLLPYETVYRFSRLYDLQEVGVETMWRTLALQMISLDAFRVDETAPVLRAMQVGFGQLHSQEDFLLSKTRELIEEVCTESPVPTCESS